LPDIRQILQTSEYIYTRGFV